MSLPENDYQILKLTDDFYKEYPNPPYVEIMKKQQRAYNCILFQTHYGYFICVPYRTEISHKYAYHFKNSKRSIRHKSGLDYTKIVIITNTKYIDIKDALIDKDEYNAVLMDFHNNRYYLYVDAISYYHKVSNNYEENSESYLSKRLDYGKKTGYIQIDEVDSNYFVQFVFHYAKMEAYVPKDEIVDVVSNMCSVLRSVKFHDAILDSLIGENVLDYKEEDFSLFKADPSKENFLDVVEREETDLYKKDLEDEKIDLDN